MTGAAIVIGGRSGSGKTTVLLAVHELLAARGVTHFAIDGDYLDMAYPPPAATDLNFDLRRLRDLADAYADRGIRAMVYCNTMACTRLTELARQLPSIARFTPVLLECPDDVAASRLIARDRPAMHRIACERSRRAAALLAEITPPQVLRIDTARTGIGHAAELILERAGW